MPKLLIILGVLLIAFGLAWLAGEERNVPTHRHYHGVEIHLGYAPTHGVTVLGDAQQAHLFAEAINTACRGHNAEKTVPSAQR